MREKFKYIKWLFIGLIVGIITAYLRGFNSSTFWSLSVIAGRFGFWIFTVSLIAYYSKNKKDAFINNLFYGAYLQ